MSDTNQKQITTVAERGQNIARGLQRELTSLLPTGVEVPKFMRQVATAFERVPKLLECDQQSLRLSFLNVAGLGLDPSGMTGEAYVLPFKGKATPLISYRGYIALATRSGAVTAMDTGVAHEGDDFDFEQGSNPYIKHRRAFGSKRGPVMCYYAIATLPNGHNLIEIMDVDEVQRIASRSPSGKNGPWGTDFDEMGRKTVCRRLAKRIPWNADIAAKMTEAHLSEDSALYDTEAKAQPQKPTARLTAVMGGKKPEPAPEAPQVAETTLAADDDQNEAQTVSQQASLFEPTAAQKSGKEPCFCAACGVAYTYGDTNSNVCAECATK